MYVELRSIFEALGYTVSFDAAAKSARIKQGADEFILENGADSKSIVRIKNGQKTSVPIEFPLQNDSGRILIALRSIGELAGYQVGWDDKTKTSTLTSSK